MPSSHGGEGEVHGLLMRAFCRHSHPPAHAVADCTRHVRPSRCAKRRFDATCTNMSQNGHFGPPKTTYLQYGTKVLRVASTRTSSHPSGRRRLPRDPGPAGASIGCRRAGQHACAAGRSY